MKHHNVRPCVGHSAVTAPHRVPFRLNLCLVLIFHGIKERSGLLLVLCGPLVLAVVGVGGASSAVELPQQLCLSCHRHANRTARLRRTSQPFRCFSDGVEFWMCVCVFVQSGEHRVTGTESGEVMVLF